MKTPIRTFLFSAAMASALLMPAQQVCDTSGNLMIYSNYDGGILSINVDVNIPNLRIGVLSYEFTRVVISGTYAGNVTAVQYAGFDANNNHCSLQQPFTSSITGAPNATTGIVIYPGATYPNPNGSGNMVCAYSCDTATNQGGCNTPDQVVHYFLQSLGGTFYAHRTQYGCWPAQPAPVSLGGNCCIVPQLPTAIAEQPAQLLLHPRVLDGRLWVDAPGVSAGQTVQLAVFDTQGRLVSDQQLAATGQALVVDAPLPAGLLLVRLTANGSTLTDRFVVAE